MAYEFKLPDIGEGLVEGEIVKWLVGVGDTLDEDQPMVEVMTDKASRFSRQLQGRFQINTELIDERLTTREAYVIAIESGKRKSKPEIDSLSAVLITETWLREYKLRQDTPGSL